MMSPALTAAPRSLEQVLAELTAEHERVHGELLFLECGAGALSEAQIRQTGHLRRQMYELRHRITDLECEISLRRARAAGPPVADMLRAAAGPARAAE